MVKSFSPVYTPVTYHGKQHYECCQCGRVHNTALKAAVHVYYNHVHLRVQAAKQEIDLKDSSKYLYGLLAPKRIEAFKKSPTKRSPRVSAASSPKSEESARKSQRVAKIDQFKLQKAIQQNLKCWIDNGKMANCTAKVAAKTPKTANTRDSPCSVSR